MPRKAVMQLKGMLYEKKNFILEGIKMEKRKEGTRILYCFEYIKANREAEEFCFGSREKAEEIRQMYVSMGAIVSEVYQKEEDA